MDRLKFRKRDTSVVTFNKDKIQAALVKAFNATLSKGVHHEGKLLNELEVESLCADITHSIITTLLTKVKEREERGEDNCYLINIEECQITVEDELMNRKLHDVARNYITYRAKRDEMRSKLYLSKAITKNNRRRLKKKEIKKFASVLQKIKDVVNNDSIGDESIVKKLVSEADETYEQIFSKDESMIIDSSSSEEEEEGKGIIDPSSKEIKEEEEDDLQVVSDEMRKQAEEAASYFKSAFELTVYYRTYSRWDDKLGRREMWPETVDRYMNFLIENLGPIDSVNSLSQEEYTLIRNAILNMDIMPSMRLLQFAGAAARRNNLCAYNCCFIAPTSFEDVRDIMYILMNGTGVGFSVEEKFTSQFPNTSTKKPKPENGWPTFVIEDSKEGWTDSLLLGLKTWFAGDDIHFDYSKIRPFGSKLVTMGGTASGPEPLRNLLNFTKKLIFANPESKLAPINWHDVICMIASTVVVGSVRRSALISLSNLHDEHMRTAKCGNFWETAPHRYQSNNSAVYVVEPNDETFMEEWLSLIKSNSGERGIFNRSSLIDTLPHRRLERIGKETYSSLGTNPCGEIILQSAGLCNLSTVVCRPNDTEETLLRKIHLATILGTYQATLTNFKYVQDKFKMTAEQERLLGVSLAGQQDCPAVRNPFTLQALKHQSIETNKIYSARFNIATSTCITCVKPDGTLGLMVGASPGVHPAHDDYYIRRVRIGSCDPVARLLKDQGVPCHPENGYTWDNTSTWVFEFPIKAPEGSVKRNELSAIDMLEYWKMVKINYTEHNPSVTINVKEHEWIEVLHWVKKNWKYVGGLSFLPYSGHVYKLAPYETITKEEYEIMLSKFPNIKYSKLPYYEKTDMTDVKKEYACIGGACSL